LDASSGQQIRHRLSRAGNRRINHALHIMAIVQLRHDTPGRAYYRRRVAEGKTPMEALRALKRHLSNTVYRQLLSDASIPRPQPEAGPGGHPGATLKSSADGLTTPTAVSSDKSLPGPASTHATAQNQVSGLVTVRSPRRSDARPPRRPAAGVKRPLLDAGEERRTIQRRERTT